MWLRTTAFLLLLTTTSLFAQLPGVTSSPSVPVQSSPPITTPIGETLSKGNAKISGYVVDSTLTKAVEYANIAVYNIATNKLIDGTVADDKGKFMLTKLAPGTYKLLISFLGYNAKPIDNLVLVNGQTKDVGVIRLSASTRTLNEVTVAGTKALVEDKVDRLVYNADVDLAAKGGDATDILKKVPMLSVDLSGNVSLQGNANVRVLINNKPSSILAGNLADALRQIPADLIKTVEVITSPSAKYDAEGSGGIINIITKKNTLQGLHLDVDGGAGNRTSTLGLNGSFRKGKLGVSLNGNGRGVYNPSGSDLNQTTFLGESIAPIRTRQHADGFDKGLFGQYALGLDYDIAKNQSLTGGVRFGIRNLSRDQHFFTSLLNGDIVRAPNRRDVNSQDLSNSVDMNIDYLHTFPGTGDGPQKELSLSTQYSQNHLTNNFDANNLDTLGILTTRQRNLNFNTSQEFILQVDYQTPISQTQQLEFGAKETYRRVNSQYQYLLAGPTSDYSVDSQRPDGSLLYDQNIGAAYLSYTLTTHNKITLKVGTRYEYTSIEAQTGGSQTGGQVPISIPNYGKLVPSINLSKKLNETTTIKLAYNRRIQRPNVQDLNPNFNAANPYNVSIGNPYLKPEITDRVEFGYSTYVKKTYLNLTFYTRLNKDDIQSISQRSDTLIGAVVSRRSNIGKEYNYGTNLFATITITPRWSVNTNIDIMYRYISGLALDVSGLSIPLSNTGLRWGGRFDTQLQFDKGWAIQANLGYRGKDIALQGYRIGFAQYSLGARKSFTNKRGSLGLAAENFLTNGMGFTSVLNSAQFNQDFRQYIYNSSIRLTFSYKIGNLNGAKVKKGKSAGGDEEN
ncbi:TonB-dependent receptor domain-containing protein [Spirosoma radiotolerans]|uniref:TonB-dependent receptor n=1 Tax=Spirosoma radiotolerans TaxID=1379870 RepID=A0A0E3VAK1_9BACT|nr:outer membrane beta-barrel family protein [Spirosoma radiotolerans]AKD58216.1 TonB-dependent receptor [Spirosoma radiotolerans]